jgi:hypothetical protein
MCEESGGNPEYNVSGKADIGEIIFKMIKDQSKIYSDAAVKIITE